MSTGITLHFETHGSGSPILILHGFGASLYTWRYLIPEFTSHKLILIDLKGFGKSPKPKDKLYRIQDQADLIHQFIVQHDLRELTLVGHSLGGGVALLVSLMLAKEKSDRLSRLVLIDSAGYRQPLPGFIKVLTIPIIGPIGFSLLPHTTKARISLKKCYFDDTKITRDQVTAYAEPLRSDGGSYALFRTAQMLVPANIDQITSEYNQIMVPTLIMWGRNDEVIPLEIGTRLHEAIANSEVAIIDDCGHIPHEEKPVEAIEALRAFLQRM